MKHTTRLAFLLLLLQQVAQLIAVARAGEPPSPQPAAPAAAAPQQQAAKRQPSWIGPGGLSSPQDDSSKELKVAGSVRYRASSSAGNASVVVTLPPGWQPGVAHAAAPFKEVYGFAESPAPEAAAAAATAAGAWPTEEAMGYKSVFKYEPAAPTPAAAAADSEQKEVGSATKAALAAAYKPVYAAPSGLAAGEAAYEAAWPASAAEAAQALAAVFKPVYSHASDTAAAAAAAGTLSRPGQSKKLEVAVNAVQQQLRQRQWETSAAPAGTSIDDLALGLDQSGVNSVAGLGSWAAAVPAADFPTRPPAGRLLQAATPPAAGAARAAPLLATNSGRGGKPLWGVTYSWRRAELCDAERCRCPSMQQVEQDLAALSRFTNRLRTFSVECPQLMARLLRHVSATPGFSWLLGVWVGADAAANQAQVDLLAQLLAAHPGAAAGLSGIAVGHEAVSREDVSEEELLQLISQVRRLTELPVLTVELPEVLLSSANLVAAVDAAAVSLQPYFLTQVDTAADGWAAATVASAVQQHQQLQQAAQGKPVVVAEVGWPSRSAADDINAGSIQLARAFAQEWVRAAEQHSIAYFYHELADAGWKQAVRLSKEAAAAATAGMGVGISDTGLSGEEHFGLLSADRATDKGVLQF